MSWILEVTDRAFDGHVVVYDLCITDDEDWLRFREAELSGEGYDFAIFDLNQVITMEDE